MKANLLMRLGQLRHYSPPVVGGAFTFVQVRTGSATASAASIATSSTMNVSAGSLVVLCVMVRDDNPSTIDSVGDGTNSAVADFQSQPEGVGGYRLEIWSIKNHPGGSNLTFTANIGGSGPFRSITAAEFTLGGGTATFHGSASGLGESTTPTSGNLSPTPNADGQLIIGLCHGLNPATDTGAGFTALFNDTTCNLESEYQIQAVAAAIAATFTASDSGWVAAGGSFKV